jgi:hypothetical protein
MNIMRKKVVQNLSAQRFIAKRIMYHKVGEKLKNSSSDDGSDAVFLRERRKEKKKRVADFAQ